MKLQKPQASKFDRNLSLPGALTIGLGTMIGAGIFVLSGPAAGQAGPAVTLSYVIAGLICLPVAMTVAELATAMPQAGGSYHLVTNTIGPFAGTIVGIANWLGLIFAGGFYLIGFAQYLTEYVNIAPWIVIAAVGGLFTLLNVLGAHYTGKLQLAIVSLLLLILSYYIASSWQQMDTALHTPYMPKGFRDVFATVGLIIVSFTGFEKISTTAGEIKKPARNLPIAIIGSVVIATVLYVLILHVSTGVVPYDEFATFNAPLLDTAREFMGNTVGVMAIWAAALLAMASSSNAAITTASRINFAMSRDRVLPGWFDYIHNKFDTPMRSVLLTGLISVGLALIGNIEQLAKISSVMFMASYALISWGLIRIRRKKPAWYKPGFKVPLVPVLPFVSGLTALSVILVMGSVPQIAGIGFASLGVGWYYLWVRKHYRQGGEKSSGFEDNKKEKQK
ncbi:APC family permease [Dethiobacter alkaliphilus]|uniref:Amino acid permease-associated region n=1 Tax=Dethiobacter alkaliphilus AHT 1 TaxID=555088 RepID=C0GET0_DETAL|nr:APC family permease [Dethiobacter alkaliphilus]EEG78112.1 amino acid permease-associated region [Dethiobacter alkaliphilus AHT 1]